MRHRVTKAVGGRAQLRVIALLACVLALDAADKATVGATAVQLKSSLHIGNTGLGLLVTISSAVGALASLPMGILADRVNRTRLLTAAILAWSVAMAISGAATSFSMLLWARLGLGLVAAAAGPAVASLTGDWFSSATRGRVYGFILTGELAGAGLGLAVSGDLAAATSWRYSFWLLAILGLALAVTLRQSMAEPARDGTSRFGTATESPDGLKSASSRGSVTGDEPVPPLLRSLEALGVEPHQEKVLRADPTERSLWWAVRYVLSIRTNVTLVIASALGYFFLSGLRAFAVVFMRGRYGLGQGSATNVLLLIGAGALLGVLVTGRVTDRRLTRGSVTARPTAAGVAFLLCAALFIPGLLTHIVWLALPCFFVAAAGLGGANPPLDAARLDLISGKLWGRAESVRTILRSSVEATAPLVFGYVSTQFGGHGNGIDQPAVAQPAGSTGLDDTLLIMMVPLVAAGLLLLLSARRTYPADVATAVASDANLSPG